MAAQQQLCQWQLKDIDFVLWLHFPVQGAEPWAVDSLGATALHYAAASDKADVLQLLLDAAGDMGPAQQPNSAHTRYRAGHYCRILRMVTGSMCNLVCLQNAAEPPSSEMACYSVNTRKPGFFADAGMQRVAAICSSAILSYEASSCSWHSGLQLHQHWHPASNPAGPRPQCATVLRLTVLFVERCRYVNLRTQIGLTAIHCAVRANAQQALAVLLTAGGNPSLASFHDCMAWNNLPKGSTALHLAARTANTAAAMLLLRAHVSADSACVTTTQFSEPVPVGRFGQPAQPVGERMHAFEQGVASHG